MNYLLVFASNTASCSADKDVLAAFLEAFAVCLEFQRMRAQNMEAFEHRLSEEFASAAAKK
jgi:hypothetical protein